ncbi:MAG: CpaD family pilus assembly lipoprotein [Hoeflea sp.]|uniref:CpaD family pilus assembly protein n=1 Tax=Hoeflea sp. TaxID=1940281 RepID=UPI001DC10848|nr:CpaD family pilus assembly lipoprotein [Hoeflea sp.]MBU4531638.1 CpaD family pilus assembly lipoprotein [Alphaproteobacteria bacterium]MBU4544495.1 CpaD family pilus assembly lipoprotein [Alphaproteobacteria bacterium]MBU4552726.1 CpaD family pilus assembly lipoprotein [Alphaproteobacteria bacterium]MBV1724914.1 CpaD family pilus assembly lipoprotein [Hoeflea sp.]MBV1760934.1 CpaD family pilus assembly lipoprotein [Hoeflea sp.]
MSSKIPVPANPDLRPLKAAALPLLMAVTLLSGCAGWPGRSITVGAVPDDYRTNHPIIVAEKERTVDLPVSTGDRKLTISMRETVRGAATSYRSSASGIIRIMVPVGSANAGAASVLSGQVADVLRKEGIPGDRILSSPYHVSSPNDAAPIRIAFMAITASTGECGRWPEDMLANTTDNKHYANFGCATQNNLAAQIANPGDLIAPRGMTSIDAERRSVVIETYRENGAALE